MWDFLPINEKNLLVTANMDATLNNDHINKIVDVFKWHGRRFKIFIGSHGQKDGTCNYWRSKPNRTQANKDKFSKGYLGYFILSHL